MIEWNFSLSEPRRKERTSTPETLRQDFLRESHASSTAAGVGVTFSSHSLSQPRPSFCLFPPPQPQRLPISVTSALFSRFRSPSLKNNHQSLSSRPASQPLMSSIASQDTTSTISLDSQGSMHEEDWDRSESEIQVASDPRTPRNSVLFPADATPDLSPRKGGRRENRTLSELLKLYSGKGTNCQFSQEEATRIADVLGQWVCLSRLPRAPRELTRRSDC